MTVIPKFQQRSRMKHTTRPHSNEVRDIVIAMKESGKSAKEITEVTKVSSRSQNRYLKKSKTGSAAITKQRRSGIHNGRTKVNNEYMTELRDLVDQEPTLYDNEIADELFETTGIRVTASHICRLRNENGLTRKKLSVHYPERYDQKNIKLAQEFCSKHRRVKAMISLQHCSSTDECGFKSDIQRTHGKGVIKITKEQNKNLPSIRKVSGGSYSTDSSKIFGMQQKHASWKDNLIATISLDPQHPVIGFQFSEEYVNGVIFSHYVDSLRFPEMVTHDLMDKASFHVASASNQRKNKISVSEIYENKGVEMDFVPRGYPEYNPIEQLFGWLKQYLRKVAPQYHNGEGWTRDEMRRVLEEAKGKVTHEMVKSWYRNCFKHMHPGQLIPQYLRGADQ